MFCTGRSRNKKAILQEYIFLWVQESGKIQKGKLCFYEGCTTTSKTVDGGTCT